MGYPLRVAGLAGDPNNGSELSVPRDMLGTVASRPISPVFVGRRREFGALGAALRRMSAGQPAVVVIGGEAGVGKSRLVEEFLAGSVAGRARVLSGGCVELGGDGLPFTPVVAALRSLLRDLPEDRVDELLGSGREDLARLLPELGDASPEPFLGELSRGRLFEILIDLLERLGREQPLVLVLEDLHWADRSTQELFGFLVRSLRASSVLLVATYRSDELHRGHPMRAFLAELDRVRSVDRIELPRLDRGEVGEQLTGILGTTPEPALVERVFSRTEGNPFFVEELAWSAAAGGRGVSDSLRDLLLARVERLAPATQRLLRVATAGGGRIDYRLLAAVADLPEVDLYEALRDAVSSNVLVTKANADAPDSFAFRHSLLREVLHEDLLPGEHSGVHMRYAEALERQPDLIARNRWASEIAHHWYSAHHLVRALPAYLAAADQAERVYAFAEQRRILERVLEIWDRVPEAEKLAGVDHLGVLERTIEAAHRAGDHERGLALATAAAAEVDRAGDPERAALLLNTRAKLLGLLGRPGGDADLRTAEALVAGRPESWAQAAVFTSLASSGCEQQPAEALHLSHQAITAAQRVGDRQMEALARTSHGHLLARMGEVDRGLAEVDKARALAEEIGDAGGRLKAHISLSDLLEALGRHEESVATARDGVALARQVGLARTHGAFLVGNLVESLLSLGRWDEAERLIAETLELDPPGVQAVNLHYLRGFQSLARGDQAGAQGDLDVVRGLLAREYVSDQYQLPVAVLEASLALERGEPVVAVRQALDELARQEQAASARYVWPLLAVVARAGAEAALAARDRQDVDAVAAADRVRAVAAGLPADFPVPAAWRAVVAAELLRAEGKLDEAAWREAVAAWDRAANPYPLAYALFRHAEAAATSGDRAAAAESACRASEIAWRLGARPLAEEVGLLARRARLPSVRPVKLAATGAAADSGAHPADLRLTPREVEVLRGVAGGHSNRQIAEELFISVKTASVHVSNILAKLGVSSRGEAAALAHRRHLFDDDVLNA
jgi:DNA-binding CsgD family transcriptional regulator